MSQYRKKIDPEMLPFEVLDVMKNLGQKISIARRARKWTQPDMAGRVGVGLNTMVAIERGSPSVQFGSYVMALWALNLLDEFERIARPQDDEVTLSSALKRLPKRVTR